MDNVESAIRKDLSMGEDNTKRSHQHQGFSSFSNELTHNWSSFRSSCCCRCFSLVFQLVLLASLGSFLFGFNISLLNTAIASVNSDFLMCGPVPIGFADVQLVTSKEQFVLNCKNQPNCNSKCFSNDNFTCNSGGYSDVNCPQLKWYNAFLSCAILIGGAIGSMTGGRFMAYGRRLLLLITMSIFAVGVICSVCANSFSAMMWARLIVGYAVGLVSVAAPTYMSEVTPPEKRGKYGVCHQMLIGTGIFISAVLGIPLQNPAEQAMNWVPGLFQRFWWRFMLGLGILPALLALYLLLAVYTFETPVYYVEQRRFKDAAALLELIYAKDDVKEELEEVIDQVRQGEESKKNGLTFGSALSYSHYRYVIIIGCILSMGQQFGGINVFMTSSSDLFKKAGLPGKMQIAMTGLMALINVLMTLPTICLIERVGRRTLLLVGSTFQFVAVVPAAISYWTEKNPSNPGNLTQNLAIVAVLGFVLFFAVAYGPVLWVYLFEIYPMEIKDVAAGVATGCNWLAGIVMVFVSIVLPNHISFSIFSVLQLLVTIFIFFFMRETKGRNLGDSPYMTKAKKEANMINV